VEAVKEKTKNAEMQIAKFNASKLNIDKEMN
jgi:hypothetical protein